MKNKDCTYVDTSAIISRLFAPKDIREKVNEILKAHEKKVVSTYVVGEFKRTVIRDLIFLRNMLFDYRIEETLKRLSRLPRTRRVSNILSILGSVILAFREYFSIIDATDLLRIRASIQCFHNISIVKDSTECQHANVKEVSMPDGHITVAFRCKGCRITEFVKKHEKITTKIRSVKNNDITCGKGFQNIVEGRKSSYYCKKISDCIISVIASEKCKTIISCNPKDFVALSSALSIQHIDGCER